MEFEADAARSSVPGALQVVETGVLNHADLGASDPDYGGPADDETTRDAERPIPIFASFILRLFVFSKLPAIGK